MVASRIPDGPTHAPGAEAGLVPDIRVRLERIRETIAEAARKSGRDPSDVTLVAVTKGHPVEVVRAVLEAGVHDIGENRVEELEEKVALVGRDTCRWHMVGHLQRRKAPRILEVADLLHSVDSLRLAERLQRVIPGEREAPFPVLVQVNTSGEASKWGFEAEDVLEALGRIVELSGLHIRGLMTMAPLTDDEALLRRTFRRLRELNEEARGIAGYDGAELSMGMSNDYRIAVEEGGTTVRLGTALLGERPG